MTTAEKKPPTRATLADKNGKPDVQISNHSSLFLFHAETQLGMEWINEHVPSDATFFAGALYVEPRYALDLAAGMVADGLRLE